MTPSGLHRKLE